MSWRLSASCLAKPVSPQHGYGCEVVAVTEPIVFAVMGRDTLEEALVVGDEVLIGQTVLEKLDLLADCANRRLVANPAHPDQPVSKVKRPFRRLGRTEKLVLMSLERGGKKSGTEAESGDRGGKRGQRRREKAGAGTYSQEAESGTGTYC